jgi:uncharacterized protein
VETAAHLSRADDLRAAAAAVRFLSLEPLLGPLPDVDLTGIDWVIAGGESGPRARPMDSRWVIEIRDRCRRARVPFFFKHTSTREAERGSEASLEGDELDNKVKRIREIRLAGFEVAHVIHRHGMDERAAFEVEAGLIDACPGLTNIVGGAGQEFGAMHAKEIVARYCAEPAVFRNRALLISVNRTAEETSLYEALRYAWKISKAKVEQAEVILATFRGLIVGAFVADEWREARAADFPGHEDVPGRLGFMGREAPPAIAKLYVGKRVPDEYRKRGAANPIRYTWSSRGGAGSSSR